METLDILRDKKTDVRESIIQDLLPKKFGKMGMAWTSILILCCLVGAYAYYRQLRFGLVVTAMRDYVSWGIYISNFVFFCCNKPGRVINYSNIPIGQR